MAKPIKHRGKWRIRPVGENGVRQSAVFVDYRTAQLELSRRQVDIEEIKRGLRHRVPPRKRCNDLFDYWERKRARRKRSKKDDLSIIRKHLRPYFGTMFVDEVDVDNGDEYINVKIDDEGLGEKTVRNHLTLFTTMLNVVASFKRPWLLKVSEFNKPKVALYSTDYQWLRSDDEIRRFLAAARAEGEMVFVFYMLAIFTGMRAGEIAALEWSDIDFDRRLISVQRSFYGPPKSGKVRHAPILDPLLPVLRAWRTRHPGQLVFTNQNGKMFCPSSSIYQDVLHRVLEAAGFDTVVRNRKQRPYVRFHDLRHTFASHWVSKGGDIFKLMKILGHSSIRMTERYAHLAPDAFTADYARLGAELVFGAAEGAELKPNSHGESSASA